MRRVAKDRWWWFSGGRGCWSWCGPLESVYRQWQTGFESRCLSCNSDPEEPRLLMHQTAELKIAPPGRADRQGHLCSGGPLFTLMSISSLQVPSAMNAESFFCEEMLSWDFLQLLRAAQWWRIKEPGALFVFSVSLIPFLHRSTIISRCGREGAEGQRRRCVLETTTRRHTEEDSSGASESQREMDSEGKKTILSLSLLGFFVLFHSLCWQSGMTPCYWQEAVHVTIPTFS